MASTAVAKTHSPLQRFILSPTAKTISMLTGMVAGGLALWLARWFMEDPSWNLGKTLGLLLVAVVAATTITREVWAESLKRSREGDLESKVEHLTEALDAAQRARDEAAQRARLEAYRDVLDPLGALHQAVGDLLGEPDYQVGLRQFRIALVACAAQLMPEPGHRACFYSVDETDGSDEGGPSSQHADLDEQGVLVLAAFRGRPDEPRHSFTGANSDGANPHGQRFLEVALGGGGPTCFTRIDNDDAIRPSPNAVYKSFMLVPVRKGSRSFGALSIDCSAQIEYDDRHRKIGTSLALLLAVAEGRATQRSRSRGRDDALRLASAQIAQRRLQAAP